MTIGRFIRARFYLPACIIGILCIILVLNGGCSSCANSDVAAQYVSSEADFPYVGIIELYPDCTWLLIDNEGTFGGTYSLDGTRITLLPKNDDGEAGLEATIGNGSLYIYIPGVGRFYRR